MDAELTVSPMMMMMMMSSTNRRTARRDVFLLLDSLHFLSFVFSGTFVTQVTATDADDPTYGNSARIVYSILHGQPYFSVDPKTGM